MNNYSRKIKYYANIIWKVGFIFSIIIAVIGIATAFKSEENEFMIFLLSLLISGFLIFVFWIIKIFIIGFSVIVQNNEEAIEERVQK